MDWAIVGVGGSGRGHAKDIAKTPGLNLVGIFDIDPNAAEEAAAAYGMRIYPTLDVLLADTEVKGVTLATPSALHSRDAVRLLDAGKHVLVEKPFALDEAQARTIEDAARRNDRLALPFHNRRWDPDFRMVLEVARAGTLGEVRLVRSALGGPSPDTGWRLKKSMGGGRLNDWGPHLLSQMCEWFGPKAISASGYVTTVNPENECDDLFSANLRFGSDVLVTLTMSGFSHLLLPRWEVIGSEGTLQLNGDLHGEFTLTWKRKDGEEFSRTVRRKEVMPPIPIYTGIVDHLEGRGALPVTLEEGVTVSRWLGAVRKSAEAGGAMESLS